MAHPTTLYVRAINPGTEMEYQLFGGDPASVSDDQVMAGDFASPEIARYQLVGTGRIHYSGPVYVEETDA